MISSLRGRVLQAAGGSVVLEVGGVGFLVNTTPALALASREGDEAALHTSLIVREDALTLFGFATREELEVFEILIGVTGVGPKSALGVLSALSPEQVALAVEREDDAAFRKVSGIGPKTAKLIVVSLAGKVRSTGVAAETPTGALVTGGVADSVLAALTGLGWSERVAAEAVEATMAEAADSEAASVPALLRLTLARLGPAQQAGRAR
ncbi:Holliday junction branch migration protein RuvA [Agromyces aerolatus]|uniref:Holliday junction branch migration protein RuvA n=1 Tax=Agromyces sp. LY-1074 TaxID=3074080 RepID=UPI0028543C83|nr:MULTISPECIES: Holliday junction branch migration protein RuvA [unclassified Agromyces]MDR5700603.1 Holliday junction branch migration protein RuvA [Agromyces sp. LY-1074]MDR5707124.1 Holliday junction branch migration protein RuvA [Agromyces sp. LY-1358]